RWLKQIGDEVAVDEPLLEVSTDKVDTEIPSPVAGTLLEIKANEDDTVEVGAVPALVGSADESTGDGAASGDGTDQAAEPQAEATPEPEPEPEPAQAATEQQLPEQPAAEEHAAQEPPQEQVAQKEEAPREEVAAATAGASQSSGEQTVVRLPELGESVTE